MAFQSFNKGAAITHHDQKRFGMVWKKSQMLASCRQEETISSQRCYNCGPAPRLKLALRALMYDGVALVTCPLEINKSCDTLYSSRKSEGWGDRDYIQWTIVAAKRSYSNRSRCLVRCRARK